MKARLAGMLILTAILAGLVAWPGTQASAQGDIPKSQALTLYGEVFISGEADPNGMVITARIGDDWESKPIIVGEPLEDNYQFIFIDAPVALVGQDIVFWLEDQVQADEKTRFVFFDRFGNAKLDWPLPQLRQHNLRFPFAPIATATPTLTPTVTPIPTSTTVVFDVTFYEGRVRTGSIPPPDGTLIYAVIDDYVTEFAQVFGGGYFLTVNPTLEQYGGATVEFFIGDLKAFQSDIFDGTSRNDFLLVFPPLPTPTPTPTPTATLVPTNTPIPTNTPTPTPEPTRTPTPTPTPTVVPSATPTPTPIANVTATAEALETVIAVAVAKEAEGGACSIREGGPAGLGNIALLLAPLALLAWRRFERNTR